MLVDFKVTAKTKIKAGDLLVAKANGEFDLVSQEELFRDINDKLKRQEQELNYLKEFLTTYQNNVTRLLKEVARHG